MKKTFKFFMCAAIVAAGFVGCSSEEVAPNKGGNGNENPDVVAGTPTFATFSFKIASTGAGTKAMVSDASEPANPTTFQSIRFMVFNELGDGNGICEADTLITTFGSGNYPPQGQTATVLVTSGKKRLLVLANSGAKTWDASNFTSLKGTITYNQFLATKNPVDFGTPTYASFPTNPPTVDVTGVDFASLIQVGAETAANSMVYSNILDDTSLKNLLGSVSAEQSKDPANGELSNHFVIKVQRAVAKITVYRPHSAASQDTEDAKGTLSNFFYNIRNMNRATNIFQRLNPSGIPLTPFFSAITGDVTDNATFTPFYYRDPSVTTPLPNFTTWPTTPAPAAYYMTENAFEQNVDGGNTYIAVKSRYTPKHAIVKTLTSFDPSLLQFGITTGSATSGNTFFRITATFNNAVDLQITGTAPNQYTQGIPAGTIFEREIDARKALWVIENPGQNLPSDAVLQAYAFAPGLLQTYTNGDCYYRVNVREGGTGYEGAFGNQYVVRNNWYRAALKSFSEIGSPNLEDLDGCPECGPAVPTYVTAHIEVVDWNTALSETDVKPYN